MKIGTTLNAYTKFLPIEEVAPLLAEDGYETVDFSDLHDVESALYTDPESAVEKLLEEKRRILSENGITVSQVHGPWRYPTQDGTPEGRAEWLDFMKRSVRLATHLGAPYVVVHPLMPYGANSPENPAEVIDLNVEHYARLADYAKTFNVTVCIENMPFPDHPLAHVDQIIELVDGLGRKNLKVCLDTGHANVCGMPLGQAVRMLGDRLATLHVHDNQGEKDEHLAPLEGTADFKDFAAALHEIGFKGSVSSESDACGRAGAKRFRSAGKKVAKILKSIAENNLK